MQKARLDAYKRILQCMPREEIITTALYYYEENDRLSTENRTLQDTWQEMIIQFQQMKGELAAAKSELGVLREQNRHLTGVRVIQDKNLFGRRSEKAEALLQAACGESPDADPLSEDADCDALSDDPLAARPRILSNHHLFETGSGRTPKTKGKREADLSKLPRQVVYDFDIDELNETYGVGQWRFAFWNEHKQLEVIRQSTYVKVTYTPVISYGLEHMLCSVPYEGALMPKSLVSSSLLSTIINDKYGMFLPLNRQSNDPDRFGIPLSRQTLSNWVVRLTLELLKTPYELLKERFIPYPYQQCDETIYLVIRSGKGPGSKGFIWAHRSSPFMDAPQIIIYCYENGRSADHLRDFYKDLSSHIYLSCDAYSAYPAFEKENAENVTLCGCFMHARRRFADALRIKRIKDLTSEQVAELPEGKAILLLQDIYREEGALSGLSAGERLARRIAVVKPLVDQFFDFIRSLDISDPSYSDKLKDAVLYSLHQENELRQFLSDGNIPIDNGASERIVKPVALGRKNYLFSNTLSGAEATAILQSLIETAKANGVDPYYYIKYLLDIMPGYIRKNRPIEDAQSLFPWSDAFRAYADKERSSYLASLKAPPGNQKPKTPRMRDLIPVENTA
ncbi:MAG: IS66 family transposase [Lachnospiraceae bacterium]|nr:IS66 family transposase [Lachnospiraceae bacterium]